MPGSHVVVLVGPTAVGKTSISLLAARQCDGEVVSGDSRHFYRGMNIGTAKVSPDQRRLVPHHLIDIINPDQIMSVGEYQGLAYQLHSPNLPLEFLLTIL